jgi:glycosyltransferase involved in cell wall biosynthesis
MANGTPRLCFIGPMIGINPGHVTTQGEIISTLFKQLDYQVARASFHLNRYARLIDIVATIIKKRREIDILIVHTFGGPSFVIEDIASRLGRLFGHRVIMFLHGGAFPQFMANFPRWARRVLGRAHAIVAPSDYLARAIELYGFQARIIPNIINISVYPYRNRSQLKPRLFWMRSFHEVWNPLMAVRVLARIREKYPGATLVMAGQDKGLQTEARKLAHELGVIEAVRFPGYLNLADKIEEFSRADIFINTNRIDNMPVALIEACAIGLPVVTSNVGGIPYLFVDGETALFVRDDDDQQMAEAIYTLLDNPALAAKLSAAGRLLAERSSWDQVRPKWEEMFREALKGKQSAEFE